MVRRVIERYAKDADSQSKAEAGLKWVASINSNHIKTVSGLDNLKLLNVLSLGKNKLSNLDETIKYLSKLKNNL